MPEVVLRSLLLKQCQLRSKSLDLVPHIVHKFGFPLEAQAEVIQVFVSVDQTGKLEFSFEVLQLLNHRPPVLGPQKRILFGDKHLKFGVQIFESLKNTAAT